MTAEPTVGELTERLERAGTVEDVRRLMADVARCPRTHTDAAQLAAIESRAIEYLRQATAGDPPQARSALVETLLPRCLDLADEYAGPWPRYTELLGDWLQELPPVVRTESRDEVIRTATRQLDAGNLPVGLRLLSRVGYSRPDIRERLKALASTAPGELGERALGVLAYLGIQVEEQPWFLGFVHERLGQGAGYRTFDVAGRIGTRETLDLVLTRLEQAGEEAAPGSIDDAFALRAAVNILNRVDDTALASEVWRRVWRVAATHPRRQLEKTLDGGLVKSFPSVDVVPDLAARLGGAEANYRWIIYLRMKECVLPVQANGWDTVPTQHLEPARRDALREVSNVGISMTSAFADKEEAWETLLCVGRKEEVPSLDRAIRVVAGGYVKSQFLDLAACLGLPELPGDVRRVFAAELPDARWAVDEHLVAQVGAVHAAHACVSADGFESLLLDYQPARDGILISVIEAVSELAHPDVAAGDRGRIARLLAQAEEKQDTTARTTARAALARLLGERVLTPEEAWRVVGAPALTEADPYSLRALFYALCDVPDLPLPLHLLSQVETLALSARSFTERESEAGLPAAAELLYALHVPESESAGYYQRFGLVEREGQTHLINGPAPNTAYLLAGRYTRNPPQAAPAVVALLAASDPFRAARVLAAIREVGQDNPPEVVRAVMALVHRMDDGLVALPDLIDLLAEIAPRHLLADGWVRLEHWLPQARVAMASALGQLQNLSEPDNDLRHHHLVRLAGDGVFAVRRAACRAFAACDADALHLLNFGWANAQGEDGEELRRRAAEAVAWVARPQEFAFLGWDAVAGVRDAYHQSLQQRGEREVVDFHLERVLAVTSPPDVLSGWRYGVGLAQVGDDNTVQILKRRARATLPPNVRYWLGRIRKKVQRRWDEVVQKWPQPVFTRRGGYEVVSGEIESPGVGAFPVKVHLWLDYGGRPMSLSSWGGWAEPEGSQAEASRLPWFGLMQNRGQETLKIAGRPTARILITRLSAQIMFSGDGLYPHPNDAVSRPSSEHSS